MTKCFVEPVREQLLARRTTTDDRVMPLEVVYDYATVRGVQCAPKAPACRHWRWKKDRRITLDSVLNDGATSLNACCGNCYFCCEV